MGMEAIELVIALEDAFHITLTEEDLEGLFKTPKDIINLIATKVELSDQPQQRDQTLCFHQAAFHFIRKILVEEYGFDRKQCRLSTDITALIPKKYHKELWEKIGQEANISDWPALSRPSWVVSIIWIFALIGLILLTILYTFLIGIGGLIGILAVGLFITRPLRSEIPYLYRKINQLVKLLVPKNPEYFKKSKTWTYGQIRLIVKNIIMETLYVDEYNEMWDLVNDFGMGR